MEHGPKAVLAIENHSSFGKDELFDNLLDRSWLRLDEFEEEKHSLANKDSTHISLICSVTLDLTDVVEDL